MPFLANSKKNIVIPEGFKPKKGIHFLSFGYINFDKVQYAVSATFLIYTDEDGFKISLTPMKDIHQYNVASKNGTIDPIDFLILGQLAYLS